MRAYSITNGVFFVVILKCHFKTQINSNATELNLAYKQGLMRQQNIVRPTEQLRWI